MERSRAGDPRPSPIAVFQIGICGKKEGRMTAYSSLEYGTPGAASLPPLASCRHHVGRDDRPLGATDERAHCGLGLSKLPRGPFLASSVRWRSIDGLPVDDLTHAFRSWRRCSSERSARAWLSPTSCGHARWSARVRARTKQKGRRAQNAHARGIGLCDPGGSYRSHGWLTGRPCPGSPGDRRRNWFHRRGRNLEDYRKGTRPGAHHSGQYFG